MKLSRWNEIEASRQSRWNTRGLYKHDNLKEKDNFFWHTIDFDLEFRGQRIIFFLALYSKTFPRNLIVFLKNGKKVS